jgi:outer membrane protein OmpA-like peptidoglycan-associated protein
LLLLEEDIGEGNPVAITLQREVIKQCPKAFIDFQQRKRINNPFPPGSLVVNSGVPLVKQEVPLVKPGGSLVGSGVSLVKPGESLYRPDKVLVLTETDREIRVTVAADLLFDFDNATIRPDGALALKQLAVVLRGKKTDAVSIEGHTDSIGSNAYNMRLSLQRATAVKTWLAKNEGFNVAMFRTQGFGASRPVASNTRPDGTDNPDGRQLNRRVELVIMK